MLDHTLYVSSYHSNTDPPHIDVATLCTHMDMLDTDGCVDGADPLSVTLSLSDDTTCSTLDMTDDIERAISDSLCDHGCGDGLFGPSCVSCSSYRASIGHTADAGYEWDDDSTYYCDTKRTDGRDKCEDRLSHSACMLSNDCEYVGGECVYADTTAS